MLTLLLLLCAGSLSPTLGDSEPVLLEKTCDTGHLSDQLMELTARMEGNMARMEDKLRQEMEEKEAEISLEFEAKLEEKEKKQKAEVVNAVSNAVKDLPFEVVCSYQDYDFNTLGTITYDRFISNYNNADRQRWFGSVFLDKITFIFYIYFSDNLKFLT